MLPLAASFHCRKDLRWIISEFVGWCIPAERPHFLLSPRASLRRHVVIAFHRARIFEKNSPTAASLNSSVAASSFNSWSSACFICLPSTRTAQIHRVGLTGRQRPLRRRWKQPSRSPSVAPTRLEGGGGYRQGSPFSSGCSWGYRVFMGFSLVLVRAIQTICDGEE